MVTRSILLSIALLGATPLAADPAISIELNKVEPAEQSCLLSFVIANGTDQDLSKAVYETVLFTKDGAVDRLTLFDFADLPAGKPRVRQFAVGQLACADLGQVLFNGVQSCEVAGHGSDLCQSATQTSSRVDVEVAG